MNILSYNFSPRANAARLLTEDGNAAKIWDVFGMEKSSLMAAPIIMQPLGAADCFGSRGIILLETNPQKFFKEPSFSRQKPELAEEVKVTCIVR
jgi:hypothetical protein